MALTITLHVLAAVLWVGGMLAMLLVVRPTAVALLEPPLRLRFMATALGRFFPWVWGAVVVLPVSGYWMLFTLYGGFAQAPLFVHLMQGLAWLMIGLFVWLYFTAYQRLKCALAQSEPPKAAAALEAIRRIVLVNSVFGVVVFAVAVAGRYWAF